MNNSEKKKADPAQEAAIRHAEGPCAVIAGPGSGKTFVLTRRILHLITCFGIDPSSILVLTFSKAAALAMRTRFLGQCGREQPGQEVVFGTCHALGTPDSDQPLQERSSLQIQKSVPPGPGIQPFSAEPRLCGF